MRWWPPFLHLLVLALLVPLAVMRVGAALEPAPVAVTAGPAEGALDAGAGEAVALPVAGGPVDPESVLQRPLFVPGRQAETGAAPVAAEESVPDRAAGLRMVGYLNDGTKARAILALEATGAEAVLREGEEFEGFLVRQITRDSVIVVNQGEEITVKLFDQ